MLTVVVRVGVVVTIVYLQEQKNYLKIHFYTCRSNKMQVMLTLPVLHLEKISFKLQAVYIHTTYMTLGQT